MSHALRIIWPAADQPTEPPDGPPTGTPPAAQADDGETWVRIPKRAVADPNLSDADFRVLAAVQAGTHPNSRRIVVTNDQLARGDEDWHAGAGAGTPGCNKSARAVRRGVTHLVAAGYYSWTRAAGTGGCRGLVPRFLLRGPRPRVGPDVATPGWPDVAPPRDESGRGGGRRRPSGGSTPSPSLKNPEKQSPERPAGGDRAPEGGPPPGRTAEQEAADAAALADLRARLARDLAARGQAPFSLDGRAEKPRPKPAAPAAAGDLGGYEALADDALMRALDQWQRVAVGAKGKFAATAAVQVARIESEIGRRKGPAPGDSSWRKTPGPVEEAAAPNPGNSTVANDSQSRCENRSEHNAHYRTLQPHLTPAADVSENVRGSCRVTGGRVVHACVADGRFMGVRTVIAGARRPWTSRSPT
jgi:hypothetical protein